MGTEVEELSLREGFIKGGIVYLYVLAITLFGIGLGGWLALKLDMPGFILLGIIISQVLMIAGSCGIVLYRRKPKKEVR